MSVLWGTLDGVGERAWWEGIQEVLNAHPVPARFVRARVPIPVTARLVWEHDGGEETIDTEANGWTRDLVLVIVDDARCHIRGIWLPVADIHRR
ncbi:hypothetical protein [Georgenia yuyongxinii]|uniref:Uncharacterized protein n=1 Tax=Georgenia yuyongxinii TaxID=2589797 RepID=A0A552WRZ0_9MICO|nr:hypothetical protein [Georgenia yuyongxinii]TRW45598.1 hypothetical protein FJ693_08680 [Georgenia yuyongxinii]